MSHSTQAFLQLLEQWVKAVRQDDFGTARRCAQQMIDAGELLVDHPDFQRSFQQHCNGVDPRQALFHMCSFLLCATDGQAQVLKQYLKDRSP